MTIVKADEKIVDMTGGTNLGDLTGGGGIDTLFDGDIGEAQAACATKSGTSGYAGRTYPSTGTKTITKALVYGSEDAGYVSAINPTVTLNLYAKSGAAPANATDGTLVGTLTPFTDTANESATTRTIATTTALPGQHAWVQISHNGASNTMGMAEVIFYEAWDVADDYESGYSADHPIIGYHNILTGIDADSADTDFPDSNMLNPSTSLKWRSEILTEQTLDLGVAGSTNYIGIARHNFSTFGGTVALQGRNGTDPFTDIISAFTPANDGPLIMRYPTATWDELQIVLGASDDPPEAAVIYCGLMTVLQRKLYVGHTPITMGRVTNAVAALSESGEFLGRIVLGQHSATEIALQNLTPDWVRATLDPLLEHALELPFFFAWRPDQYPNETGFCWFPPGTSPAPVNQSHNGMMQVTMPIMGITT
jgi:hypothetical protein